MSGPLGSSGGSASLIADLLEMFSSLRKSNMIYNAATCSNAGGTSNSNGSTSPQKTQSSNNNNSGSSVNSSTGKSSGSWLSYGAGGAPNDPSRGGPTKRILSYCEQVEMIMGLVNARSIYQFIRLGSSELKKLLQENNLQVLAITETWLREDSLTVEALETLLPENYSIKSVPRVHRRGGGVAIVHLSHLEVNEIRFQETKTFEYVAVAITLPGFWQEVVFLDVYRPPGTGTFGEFVDFLDEFFQLQEEIYSRYPHVVVVGDFNFRGTKLRVFEELMSDRDSIQYVSEPTRGRNILDLIFGRRGVGITDVEAQSNTFSDHKTLFSRVTVMLQIDKVKRRKMMDEENADKK